MLKLLNIENIAIIEKASVEFSGGLNILTGETGAGKSILIDSINAVTGEKTSRELIRTGESAAEVTAFFENISPAVKAKLEDNGLPSEEDGTLLLSRRIHKDGKNTCRINGAPVTVSMLRNIGISLINIHGQRDSQALLDSEKHIDFLDGFASTEDSLYCFKNKYEEYCAVRSEIRRLSMDEAYKERQQDILSFQINELENAEITVGEREALIKKKNILNNGKKLTDALNFAYNALSGENDVSGASGLISDASSHILSVSSYAKGLDVLSESLENAKANVDDCASAIYDVLRQLQDMDGNIDEIEERLDVLYKLSKKYGSTEEEMLDFLDNAKKEYESITYASETVEKLSKKCQELLSDCKKLASKLSSERKKAAEKLSFAIQNELSFLDMPSCHFFVLIEECEMTESGHDKVEFLISANPGEEPKPLGKVASGGELSRIMLAMKNVLNKQYGADTLIFDEIDAGVSGSAAGKIAVKLSDVSKGAQVLCITHLAQIAAFSDSHKFLYKEVIDGKTYTRIKELPEEERAPELARMTYGTSAEDVHIESARHMIEKAKAEKKN